jgi:hypothetical protein
MYFYKKKTLSLRIFRGFKQKIFVTDFRLFYRFLGLYFTGFFRYWERVLSRSANMYCTLKYSVHPYLTPTQENNIQRIFLKKTDFTGSLTENGTHNLYQELWKKGGLDHMASWPVCVAADIPHFKAREKFIFLSNVNNLETFFQWIFNIVFYFEAGRRRERQLLISLWADELQMTIFLVRLLCLWGEDDCVCDPTVFVSTPAEFVSRKLCFWEADGVCKPTTFGF